MYIRINTHTHTHTHTHTRIYRKLRDTAFTQSLQQVKSALHTAHEHELFLGDGDCVLGGCSPVDKVAIKVHILKEQKILKKKLQKNY